MRSQWIDKATGKTIDLNNFAYADMSGWNGYGVDFSSFIINKDSSIIEGNKIYLTKANPNSANILKGLTSGEKIQMIVKVTGLTEYVKSGTVERLSFYTNDKAYRLVCTQDGVYDINFTATSDQRFYIWATSLAGDDFNLSPNIVIEQLPLYPGALVSDGIDDYGQTAEAISEEVGTLLIHSRYLRDSAENEYIFRCIGNETDDSGILCYRSPNGNHYIGKPTVTQKQVLFGYLSRNPMSPNATLFIGGSGFTYGNSAIYRLVFIREQLDGAQVEFLKWKVDKEYRDWCRANGYEYAINQLTA